VSATVPRPATILVVDDHPMLRRGLIALIDGEPDLDVCAEAATAQAALQAVALRQPDLAIVDLGLDGADGLDLIKAIKLRHPKIRMLVLSMHDESVYAERALRAGAHGYVGKQQMGDTVLLAIRRVLGGALYLSAPLGARFAERFVGGAAVPGDSPVGALTDRELSVFRLIGQGQTTRQIAQALSLSVKTIEAHREHIKHKLALESGAALARCATLWADTGRIG
jgi:DNA-binding NarL/FixJ family response regulator